MKTQAPGLFTKLIAMMAFLLTSHKTAQGSFNRSPGLREDFKTALHGPVCRNTDRERGRGFDLARLLQSAGVYDAGVIFRVMEARKAGSLNEKKVRRLARSMAVRAGHRSWSYGLCSPRKAWAVSSPVPVPLTLAKLSEKRTSSVLEAYCRSWSLDFAAFDAGLPEQLQKLPDQKAGQAPDQKPGMLSLSCRPAAPPRAGRELWLLFPSPGTKGRKIPASPPLWQPNGDDPGKIAHWINRIRNHHGLRPLDFRSPEIRKTARHLSQSGVLKHDRRQLNDERKRLARHAYTFLGEDRVIAEDAQSMARLLWLSPLHRSLILNPRANLGGLFFVRKENLLVFVAAKAANPRPPGKRWSGRRLGSE